MHGCESLRRGVWVLALSVILAAAGSGRAAAVARITVDAGMHARMDTPVSVELEALADGPLRLEEIRDGKRQPTASQIEAGSPAKLWWVLSGETAAGTRRVYELVTGQAPKVDGIEVGKDDKALVIEAPDGRVMQYNHAIVPPPAGRSKLFERSGFIHPMWSPRGTVLTDMHPGDHIHHVGIWMPWTQTQFEGKPVDFWNLNSGQGTVRFVKFLSTTSGPVYGGFQAEQEHVALKTDSGEKVVLKEVWDVRVYNVGGKKDGYWLWDFVSTQRCVADTPLKHIEYRYGGFGYRATPQWDETNAMYLTSEGKNRKDGHGTRARWCLMGGEVDGVWEGVTMMSHPKNFRFPEPMRIWPEGKVFFNWAPGIIGDWEMKPGEDHIFRYRVAVHGKKATGEDSQRFWVDFGEPPVVKMEKVGNTGSAKRIMLFDGQDTSAWTHGGDRGVEWEVADGVMTITPGKGSIFTKQAFSDFRMHVEFNIPRMPDNVRGQGRGNSGVYIQRRYEVQILDSYGLAPRNNECASIYTVRAPDKNVCKQPGQWQSYDITFRAARWDGDKKTANARITLVHNGEVVHNDVEIPDKTGAGQPEGPTAEPILLQDHGNAVSFRNIWIESLN